MTLGCTVRNKIRYPKAVPFFARFRDESTVYCTQCVIRLAMSHIIQLTTEGFYTGSRLGTNLLALI